MLTYTTIQSFVTNMILIQVTLGEEGFWSRGSPWVAFNPWGRDCAIKNWAAGSGQDFSAQHALRSIDYAAIHLWPDNWCTANGRGFQPTPLSVPQTQNEVQCHDQSVTA